MNMHKRNSSAGDSSFFTASLLMLLVAFSSHALAAEESEKTSKDSSLSVAPLTHTEYAESRPKWVDQAATRDDDDDLLSVSSVPCRDEKLCDEALKVAMRAATETYAESLTGDDQTENWLSLDDQWINERRDSKKQYQGKVIIGNETFYESATVLRFDEEDREEILKQWEQLQVSQRLVGLGIVGVLVVAALIGATALLSIIVRRAELRVTT